MIIGANLGIHFQPAAIPYLVEGKKRREYELLLVLWVPGNLAGRDGGQGASENRLCDLTDEDWKTLSKLIVLMNRKRKRVLKTRPSIRSERSTK